MRPLLFVALLACCAGCKVGPRAPAGRATPPVTLPSGLSDQVLTTGEGMTVFEVELLDAG